jgi:hypothetical protein
LDTVNDPTKSAGSRMFEDEKIAITPEWDGWRGWRRPGWPKPSRPAVCYGFARCAVFAGLVGLAFTTLALLAGGFRTWVFAMAVFSSFL